jgi:hypothetical protein
MAYYRTLCKRLGFSDDYLQVFNQGNVDLSNDQNLWMGLGGVT